MEAGNQHLFNSSASSVSGSAAALPLRGISFGERPPRSHSHFIRAAHETVIDEYTLDSLCHILNAQLKRTFVKRRKNGFWRN